jgi:hypothetical protein
MKLLFGLTLTAIVLGTFAFTWMSPQIPTQAQQVIPAVDKKLESPFACNALALTPEIRKRHFEVLGPMLVSMRKDVREIADGYEFEFPNDEKTYQLLTEWAFQESQCCPFFDINVRLERERGALVLRLSGREGTKNFIRGEGRWAEPVNK